MTGFDFGMTAGAGHSRSLLEGNQIHTVKFDGCEVRDIQGVQDPTKTFKILDIKFSNDEGYFTDGIFEPTERDMEDVQGMYGAQPSNMKALMLKFKHLIDAVNPELGKKIDSGEQKLNAPNWDALRQLMIKATDPGKGTELQIKLVKTKKGTPAFPGFFAGYSKSGQLYMKTSFIGKKLSWTRNELTRIQNEAKAAPTRVDITDPFAIPANEPAKQEKQLDDFNLDDLGNL